MNLKNLRFQKSKDLILGCVTLILSAAYLIMALQIKTRPKMVPSYANSRIIPILLGIVLLVLSVLLILQGIRKLNQPDGGAPAEKMSKVDLLSVTLTFAVMLLYVVLLPNLGFILATIIYLFLQFIVLAPKEKRNLPLFALIAVGFTVLVFVAFRIGLTQMLPRGPIEALIGY
mgnify:CR=1 FL=1